MALRCYVRASGPGWLVHDWHHGELLLVRIVDGLLTSVVFGRRGMELRPPRGTNVEAWVRSGGHEHRLRFGADDCRTGAATTLRDLAGVGAGGVGCFDGVCAGSTSVESEKCCRRG